VFELITVVFIITCFSAAFCIIHWEYRETRNISECNLYVSLNFPRLKFKFPLLLRCDGDTKSCATRKPITMRSLGFILRKILMNNRKSLVALFIVKERVKSGTTNTALGLQTGSTEDGFRVCYSWKQMCYLFLWAYSKLTFEDIFIEMCNRYSVKFGDTFKSSLWTESRIHNHHLIDWL